MVTMEFYSVITAVTEGNHNLLSEKLWTCTETEMRNVVSPVFSVMAVMCLPVSCVSSMAVLYHTPAVSMANWQIIFLIPVLNC